MRRFFHGVALTWICALVCVCVKYGSVYITQYVWVSTLLRCAAVVLISVCVYVCVCVCYKQSWILKKTGSQVPHLTVNCCLWLPSNLISHRHTNTHTQTHTHKKTLFASKQIDTCRKGVKMVRSLNGRPDPEINQVHECLIRVYLCCVTFSSLSTPPDLLPRDLVGKHAHTHSLTIRSQEHKALCTHMPN